MFFLVSNISHNSIFFGTANRKPSISPALAGPGEVLICYPFGFNPPATIALNVLNKF